MKYSKKLTKIKDIATYQSGRTEEIHCKLTKANFGDAAFQKKVSALRSFPIC